jgi:CheY-like chemotaxis protein
MIPEAGPEQGPVRRVQRLGGKLIIADDSAEMRFVIRAVIGDAFTEVAEAADGRELIWQLMRSRRGRDSAGLPGLVVIADVCMPTYDGLQVLTAWQDGEAVVPLVVITSFPSDEARERAAVLGAQFLPKPFTRADLRKAVEAAIAAIRTDR